MIEIVLLTVSGAVLTLGWASFILSRADDDGELSSLIDVSILAAAATVATAALLALLLAVAGRFNLPLLAVSILLVSAPLYIPRQHRQAICTLGKSRSIRAADVALIGLLVVSFALYYPPFEEISLHQDGNVYLEAAALTARTGSLIEQHSILNQMDEEERKIFFNIADPNNATQLISGRVMSETSIAFYGFYIADENEGLIVPQYLHLLPALMAPAFAVGGTSGALLVSPLVAVGVIAVVARLGARLFGPWPGMLSAGALALMPIQLWFARYPNPEILSAFLLLTGILAIATYCRVGRGPSLLVLGSTLIGACAFARLDGILFAPPLIAWLLFIAIRQKATRAAGFAAASYSLMIAGAGLYYAGIPATYIDSILGIMLERRIDSAPLSLAAATLAGAVAASLYGLTLRLPDTKTTSFNPSQRSRTMMAVMFALPLIIFASSAYIGKATAPISTGWWNIEMLSWYWGWMALTVVPLGIAAGVFYQRSPAVMLLFGLLIVPTLYYLDHLGNQNIHPWGMRRYVDATIPLIALALAGLASVALASQKPLFRKVSAIASLTLLLVMTSSYLPYSMHLAAHVEFDGLVDQTAFIANRYSGNEILLLHNQFVLPSIGPALRYLHGVDAILVWEEPSTVHELETYLSAVQRWRDEGRDVYIVNPSPQFQESFSYESSMKLHAHDSVKLHVPKLKFLYYMRAEEIRGATSSFSVFHVQNSTSDLGLAVKMGDEPEGSLKGWHQVEQHGGEDFRWSSGNSSIRFGGTFPNDGSVDLIMRMNAWRPDAAPAVNLIVTVNGQDYAVEAPRTTRDVHIQISEVTGSYVDVTVKSSTWVPAEFINSSDVRELGVRIFSAKLVPR